MLQKGHYLELTELYKYNERHREALKLLNQLVSGSDSLPVPPADTQKLGPESIIEYLKVQHSSTICYIIMILCFYNN